MYILGVPILTHAFSTLLSSIAIGQEADSRWWWCCMHACKYLEILGFGRLAIAGFDNHFLGELQSQYFVYFRQTPLLYSVNLVATQVGLWGIWIDILGKFCSKQLQFKQFFIASLSSLKCVPILFSN